MKEVTVWWQPVVMEGCVKEVTVWWLMEVEGCVNEAVVEWLLEGSVYLQNTVHCQTCD